MEPEWRRFLRENSPVLYKQMVEDLKHETGWRDRKIHELREGLKLSGQLSSLVRRVVGGSDIATGQNILSVSLMHIQPLLGDIRTILDRYDH